MYGLRGLGLSLLNPPTPQMISECTTGWYYVLPDCWQYTPSAWAQMSQLNPNLLMPSPPVQPVATDSNPTPLTTPPASGEAAQETVDATVAASTAASQADILAAVQTQAPILDSGCTENLLPGICDWIVYAGAGLAGFALLMAFAGAPRGRR